MRMAGAPHHTNPRSATLDFWRKTTPYEQYKIIQAKRRKQMNVPTSSGLNKEDHLGKIIPHHEMLVTIRRRRIVANLNSSLTILVTNIYVLFFDDIQFFSSDCTSLGRNGKTSSWNTIHGSRSY